MKRIITYLFVLVLILSLAACASSSPNAPDIESEAPSEPEILSPSEETSPIYEESTAEEPSIEESSEAAPAFTEDDLIGTWGYAENDQYMRIYPDGTLVMEVMLKSVSTTTVNGVTNTTTTWNKSTNDFTWKLAENGLLFNELALYELVVEEGEYKLKYNDMVYTKLGDIDYEIVLEDETGNENEDISVKAEEYALGEPITAEGIELIFNEKGIASDVRVSSSSTGIKITAGPSVEEGKQYVYLKGTLKNTGKTAVRPVIGGLVILDGYEYDLSVDTISSSGTPNFTVDPLETVTVLLYAKVSEELTRSFGNGTLTFGFNDSFETVQLDQAQYFYTVTYTREE